jgi:hypothetical protein
MSLHLALFARPPVPGRTKTRLAPLLGPEGACALYEAFLDDALTRALQLRERHPDVELALYSADPDPGRWLRERSERWDVPLVAQQGADLGERMTHALSAGVAKRGAALVLGSDAPTLPLSLLLAARAALLEPRAAPGDGPARDSRLATPPSLEQRTAPCCIAPVADGGYILVGACGAPPSFAGVRMGTRHALADTLRANPAWPLHRLPPWYDVDTPGDLRLLRLHLGLDPAAAPRTAAQLARFALNLGVGP